MTDNGELEMARDKLEADLLRLCEVYKKQILRNDELEQEVKFLQNAALVKPVPTETKMPTSDTQSQEKDSPCSMTSEEKTDHKAVQEVVALERTSTNVAVSPVMSTSELDRSSTFRHSSIGLGHSSRLKSSSSSFSKLSKLTSSCVLPGKALPPSSTQQQQEHQFVERSKIRFNTCQLCKSVIMPMVKYYSCANCQLKVDRACFSTSSNIGVACSGKKVESLADLIEEHSKLAIPELLRECCEQIEQRGIVNENVYQECDKIEAAKLYAKFLSNKNVAILKVHKLDIGVLSGLVLHMLANLNEPLIGAKWRQDFTRACGKFSIYICIW